MKISQEKKSYVKKWLRSANKVGTKSSQKQKKFSIFVFKEKLGELFAKKM